MKKLMIAAGVLSLLAACSDQGNPNDKKAQLEKLKTQRSELNAQISQLETELAGTTTDEGKSRLVVTQPMKPSTFKNYLQIQGKVDAEDNVTLSAEMPGTVTRIHVKPGDEVSKGDILAELDNKVIVQGIAELQGGLDLAKVMYEKQRNLWEQKIGTEVQYLTAKNQKESLEKKMATLEEQLDMTRIRSSIDGVVDAVDIKLGQMLAPGLPAIRVVNFNNLEVKAEVAESFAGRINKGDEVEIIFPDLKDTIYDQIDFAARVIDPLTRTFTVQVDLGNKKEYHPNMVAILRIVENKKENALVVPVNLIQKTEQGDYVMVSEKGKAKRTTVKVGTIYNGQAEIAQGLKAGDLVIVKGYQDLNEGETLVTN